MTITLILVNTFILLFQETIYQRSFDAWYRIVLVYGTTPSLVLSQQGGGVLSSITSAFLHGGYYHLISNMSAVWVFGRRLEDACGPWRFLFFYLSSAIFADMVSTLVHRNSSIPSIGASGAVFGLMGAYLLLFPGGRIRTFVILYPFIPAFPRIRAIWIVLFFLVMQLPPAILSYLYDAQFGIGYWAHLGGFFSAIFIFFFLRPQAFHRYINDVPV